MSTREVLHDPSRLAHRKRLVAAVVALGLGVLVWRGCSEFWEIDICLDHGGRWDEARNACEGVP